MRPVRQFLRRSRTERRLLLRSFLLLQIGGIALPVMPVVSVHWVLSRLARWLAHRDRVQNPTPTLHLLLWAVTTASMHVSRASCLVRALTLKSLMAAYDLPTRLCVGFDRDVDGILTGHAWVEAEMDGSLGYRERSRYRHVFTVPLPHDSVSSGMAHR
jgi:hypothetical protein